MTDNNQKCELCERIARYSYVGTHYCKQHYILEAFKCKDVHIFITKNRISHIHSTIDNHIILKRQKNVLEMCNLLGMLPDKDYWFGKGKMGSTDFSDSMHIINKSQGDDDYGD